MIYCSNDILTIGPALTRTEILGKLAECGEQYVASWLPRILSADLPATLEVLLAKDYTWLTAGQKQRVRTEVREATASEIEKRFREMVAVRIQRCPGQDIQIEFRKTLRVPDDGKTYPLPPGLGSFPIENLAHHAERIPASWGELGGVLVPMHQSEAMWLDFDGDWPIALKIGTGTVKSINGRNWTGGLIREPQGYVVLPEQPWLDGYCAAPGVVRQFVATSLGKGQSAEEQTLGTMRGGLQLEAFPLKVESYFEKKLRASLPRTAEDLVADYLPDGEKKALSSQSPFQLMESMGLGAGGRIKQEIYEDQWEPQDWDLARPSRTWIHLVDSAVWKVVTGRTAPGEPLTAKEYIKHGFPWFDYYRDDMEPLEGSAVLANLKSVFDPMEKGDKPDCGLSALQIQAIGPDTPPNKVKEWDGLTSKPADPVAKPGADIFTSTSTSPVAEPTFTPGLNVTAMLMQEKRLAVAMDVLAGRMSIKDIAKKHAITKAQLETMLGVAVSKIGVEPKPHSKIFCMLEGRQKVKILLYVLPFVAFFIFILCSPKAYPPPGDLPEVPSPLITQKPEMPWKPEPPLLPAPKLIDEDPSEIERVRQRNAEFYSDQERRHKEQAKSGQSLRPAAAALIRPAYARRITTPNGSPWPTTASYISGYEKRSLGGLSKLKVDNTLHNRDVMALLVNPATEERLRACHIPAGSDFEMLEMAPGTYDIRYMDLDSGETFKTEPFTMTETPRFNSTEYSEISLTIYRVVDGNMETTHISKEHFPE